MRTDIEGDAVILACSEQQQQSVPMVTGNDHHQPQDDVPSNIHGEWCICDKVFIFFVIHIYGTCFHSLVLEAVPSTSGSHQELLRHQRDSRKH